MKTPRLALFVFVALGVAAMSAGAQKPAQGAKKTTLKKAEPRKFGFTVVDAEVETCCTDSPDKPTPTGRVFVTGHDISDWRVALSCLPEFDTRIYPWTTLGHGNPAEELAGVQNEFPKKVWMDVGLAAFEPDYGQPGSRMVLYNAVDFNTLKKVGSCYIEGSVDRATDTFGVYVNSSKYFPKAREYVLAVTTTGTTADGKKMENMETLTLECTEGVQRPCVSVSPQVLWAVRNGSWIRLCDGNLTLIGAYRITSEVAQ